MTHCESGHDISGSNASALRGRPATIVLGGGGARGLAHLGAIQAIAESGIQIERIFGVSIGALAGALCRIHTDIIAVQNEVISMLTSAEFRRHQSHFLAAASLDRNGRQQPLDQSGTAWYRQLKMMVSARRHLTRTARGTSALPAKVLRALVDTLIPDLQMEDLRIPLSVVAVDLLSGERVVMESGSLRDAVQASASIPGVFPAVRKDGLLLCDIGVVDSLPTIVARSYDCPLVVAVDVGQERRSLVRCESAFDAILRIQSIAEKELRQNSLQLADIVLQPGAQNAWYDFSHPEQVIRSSYRNTTSQLRRFESEGLPQNVGVNSSSLIR